MAELHEALTSLSPTNWDSIPTDNLPPYLTQIFNAGEMICNSVPPPPEGTPFESAKPEYSTPNTATSWKDTHASTARQFLAPTEHADLQKNWGKPMKFSAKDNPLNVAVYKMAGKDRHGAWFARRSVHEGMGFAKFRKAMLREFPESLACQGGPGEGNVRGIGGDKRCERIDAEGVGRLEVYQLSAQFPGPTTPREFITLLLTSDHGITDKSAVELDGGKKHTPRSHMIVSKPISHPDAPARSGYIRGQYESVELIREIPLSDTKSDGNQGDPELNPVEWIMITRSEPGGGIPRFMVDRGTPSAMIGDIHKWLDWAAKVDPDQDAEDVQPVSQETDGEAPATGAVAGAAAGEKRASVKRTITEPVLPPQHEQDAGVVSHLTSALGAGIDSYAPAAVSSYLHGEQAPNNTGPADDSDSTSTISSSGSFLSASEMRRLSTAPETAHRPQNASSEAISLASTPSMEMARGKGANYNEKEVAKLAKQREKLDRKLASKRAAEEEKLRKAQDAEKGEEGKAQERYEREVKKQEERHARELEKLEARKAKEVRKAEEKRRKRESSDALGKVSRERDGFREEAELKGKEVELLHAQVAELQRENTALASRLGKLGGDGVLAELKSSRSRAGSMESAGKSGDKGVTV